MREVTLAEQMGAMAIVDDLRLRDIAVAEQLNLPARREEVAKRIRDYYMQNNIPAEQEHIDRGVREFFSSRLVFDSPKKGMSVRFTLWLMEHRRQIRRQMLLSTLSICVVGCLGAGIRAGYHHFEVSGTAGDIQEAEKGVIALRAEASRQREELTALTATHDTGSVPAASPLVEEIQSRLTKATRLFSFDLPTAVDRGNLDIVNKQLASYETDFRSAKDLLWRNRETLQSISAIYNASDSLTQVMSTPSYIDAASRYPYVVGLATSAQAALENGRSDGAALAQRKTEELRKTIAQTTSLTLMSNRLPALEATYKRMGLNSRDTEVIDSMLGNVRAAIEKMDTEQARSTLDTLTAMIPFAEQSLSFDMRIESPSAVQRTYKRTGGETWYAIVQAHDAGGNAIRAPVLDSETGKRTMVSTFGVRISSEVYEQIRRDKSDGHIDEAHFGDKPSKSLAIDWSPRTLGSKPDMILNW